MPDRSLAPAPDGRVEAADFLRGFSILAIVLMHLIQGFYPDLPTLVYQAAAMGGTGAHVFLFCSGFGLWSAQLRRPQSTGRFLCRRLLRVYLPYAPVVLASACVPALCVGVDRIRAVAAHLLLYKMFVPAYMESLGMQFWFVSAIVQLYLLFPLLAMLRKKLPGMRYPVVLALAVSIGWWIFLAASGLYVERVWNSFAAQFLWEFVLGMAAAEWLHRGGRLPLKRLPLAGIAVVGIGLQAAIALWGGYPLRLFNDVPALIGFGALGLLGYALVPHRVMPAVRALSRISYAWYLTHILVFTLVFAAAPAGGGLRIAVAPLAFVLSLAAAWGYSALIDRITSKFRRIAA